MRRVLILIFLLVHDPIYARKSSGTSLGTRGQGRAPPPPTTQNRGSPPYGGVGGYPPQTPQRGYPGGHQQGFPHAGGGHITGPGAKPSQSGFSSGTGPGSSSRASTLKTALVGAALGAAGGLITYQLGKAIINSYDKPFNHDGRDYYWDDKYYHGAPGQIMCSMPLNMLVNNSAQATQPPVTGSPNETASTTQTPSADNVLATATFPDGTRPRLITWGCKEGAEVCCGTDCCPAPRPQIGPEQQQHHSGPSFGSIILGIILIALLMCCCCAFLAYKFCRSAFETLMPASSGGGQAGTYDDPKYGGGGGGGDYDQHQYGGGGAYPMQPYPQQQSYNQQTYPPQQAASYPAYPTPKY